MSPVAIRTFCHLIRPQQIGLAVSRVQIGFGEFFMTLSTLMGHLGYEFVLFHPRYLMRRMAILTNREFCFRLADGRAVDTVDKLLVNSHMAGSTGSPHIISVDR